MTRRHWLHRGKHRSVAIAEALMQPWSNAQPSVRALHWIWVANELTK